MDRIRTAVFDLGMDSFNALLFVGTLGNTQLFLGVAVELIGLKFLAVAACGIVLQAKVNQRGRLNAARYRRVSSGQCLRVQDIAQSP